MAAIPSNSRSKGSGVGDGFLSGACGGACAGQWPSLQRYERISCFRSTAVWHAGMSQICCGAAVGKTRGSPCLGGYKINGPMDGSHAALSGIGEMVPQPPHMIGRTNAAAKGEASSDSSGDVGLRQCHRLRDAVAQRKLARKGRRKGAARPVGMPVVVSGGGVGEIAAVLILQVIDCVTVAMTALDQDPLRTATKEEIGEHRRGVSGERSVSAAASSRLGVIIVAYGNNRVRSAPSAA